MAFDSGPSEASRRTLDDIRRELDAEYGYIDTAEPAPGVCEAERGQRRRDAHVDRRIAEDWREREDGKDARLAHFREMSDRHLAMGHRDEVTEVRGRRSGYVVAALVGCVAGQALLLGFLAAMRYGVFPDLSFTSALVLSGREVATAAAPIQPAVDESQFSPETRSQADESAVVASSASSPAADLLPRVAQEGRASSSRQPAVVSAATIRDSVPPRVAQAPRPAPASVAGSRDLANSQDRLRAALNDWLRISAPGGAPVHTTEPVIVLGPDGRTAKTSLSVTSPIGLIPREQRWELGPRGWSLVDDRQAGLPRPMSSHER